MSELQDVHRLQAFVTVVDEGSLSAAVHKLHITQPALSTRLKLLEESLGCVLLERTGRGVRPTPMGRLVYGIAVDILQRMHDLMTTLKNHLELREGWIHLGGGATAVSGVFPEAIQAFRDEHPSVQFTLHEQNSRGVVEAVRDGSVDIGIVTRNPYAPSFEDSTAGLRVHGKIVDVLEFIAAPEHATVHMNASLQATGKRLLPMHLNKQPMILYDEGSAVRAIIDAELARHYIHPRVVMTLRSTHSMLRMVERNIGLSIVSGLSMRGGGARVETLVVEGVRMERDLLIVSAEERTLTPAADAFLALLLKLFVTS